MVYGLCVIIGTAIGGGIVWLLYSIKAKRIIEDLRGRLAVSEEKNLRIPKLEMVVAKNKTQIAALEAEIAEKVAEIAQLNQQLIDQANAAKDKLSMVNDAQSRLSQAMTELSQTAFHCDNEEFIEAMKTNIAAFQQDVLKDIARWQGIEEPEIAEPGISQEPEAMAEDEDESLEEMIAAEITALDEPEADAKDEAEIEPAEAISVQAELSEEAETEVLVEEEAVVVDITEKTDVEIAASEDSVGAEMEAQAEEPVAAEQEESTLSLKLEIKETPAGEADEDSDIRLMAKDDDVKKKLNFESESTPIRKEAG